jgi:biopolymer transport protein ExbB
VTPARRTIAATGPAKGRSRAALAALLLLAAPAFAQESARETIGLWDLFVQSFDLFSVVLITGSVAGVAVIVRAVLDIRASNIVPSRSVEALTRLVRSARLAEVREFTRDDQSFPSRVLRAALARVREDGTDARAVREAAELAASEECAAWFRKIEPLNVIGNLGPLVGLAGTVWGMILAFTTLGLSGGLAGPADLSLGISKALFHTLLGLCLATPCLLVFGFYRSVIDRLCTRAMVVSSELVEGIIAEALRGAPEREAAAGAAP